MRHSVALALAAVVLCAVGCSSLNFPSASTPTPPLAPGKGRVRGTLLLREDSSARPVSDVNLYLALTMRDNTGKELMAGFERLTAPRAISDAQGRFVFWNVDPGRYGLVLDQILRSDLLPKPESVVDSPEAILIEVVAGQEADLGELTYDFLPLLPREKPYPIAGQGNSPPSP